MAVDPSNELMNTVRGLNQRRNMDWMRSAAAVPGTVALFDKDPRAAMQYANGFFPEYQEKQRLLAAGAGNDPLAGEKLKAKILDDLSGRKNDSIQDRNKTIVELSKDQDALMEKIITMVGTAYGAEASAMAGIRGNFNTNMVNEGETLTNAVMKSAETANVGNIAGVREGISLVREAFGGIGFDDPGTIRLVRDQISNLAQAGDMAGVAVMVNALRAMGPEYGKDFDAWIAQEAQKQPGQAAFQIQSILQQPEMMNEINNVSQQALVTMAAGSAARTSKLLSTVPGMERLGPVIEKLSKQLGAAKSPEEQMKLLRMTVEALPSNTGPDTNKATLDLLDQIDTDQPLPAGNLAEARQAVFDDPAFQEFMAGNGFKDPRMALKEMRRLLREKSMKDRNSDRMLMDQRRAAGTSVGDNPAPVQSKAAQAIGGAEDVKSPGDAEDGTPTFVWGPDGKLWFRTETGELRLAEDDEIDMLNEEIGKGGDEAKAAMMTPTSQFGQLKAASDKKKAPVAAPPAASAGLSKPAAPPPKPAAPAAPAPAVASAVTPAAPAVLPSQSQLETTEELARKKVKRLFGQSLPTAGVSTEAP